MKFKVKSIIPLNDLKLNSEIPCSDYAIQTDNSFIQFEFLSEKERELTPIEVDSGVFKIIKSAMGLDLIKASFSNDNLLMDSLPSSQVEKYITTFFNKVDVYNKLGIFPKRGLLIGGPPGTGKTACINKVAMDFTNTGDYLTLIWNTDAIEPSEVKNFISRFKYSNVKGLILIAEDLGGIEGDDMRIASSSSLLALLDNQEKTFKVPTMIIATTNYLHQFPENITNRPNRFDHVFKFPLPSPEQRVKLLKFISQKENGIEYIQHKKFNDKITPAHIKEAAVRSELYDVSIESALDTMLEDILQYNKGFSSRKSDKISIFQGEE